MLAAIPYTTFPDIELGPLTLRTFGLMVALGVLLGARIGADYGERFGVTRESAYRTGTLMVIAGIVGSRITWVLTNLDQIHSPLDVVAIWNGGIQFSGGFIAALIVGMPMFRQWTKVQRWNVLNGYAYGLTLGVAIGRIGCYSVGEHFGRTTDFFLGTRYDGGSVREDELGPGQILTKGTVFHNTALYEFLLLLLLFGVMTFLVWRARRRGSEVLPGTLVALFLVGDGVGRFLTDTLRVNDERMLSMTGAQWMSLLMVPYGLYVFFKIRPEVAKLVGPDGQALETEAPAAAAGLLDGDDSDQAEEDAEGAPDELEPPDEDANDDESDDESESDDSESDA